MKTIQFTIFILLLTFSGFAQQDALAKLSKPYQTALGMLKQQHKTMPQDSLAIAQEWQRLHEDYKRVADSLKQHATLNKAIYFDIQRLIDVINYRKNDAQLNDLLEALYSCAAQHQKILIEDDSQLQKIAQCVVGVRLEGVTNETQIIQQNARHIQDFYKHLDTSVWTEDMHQRFISFFAAQYINIGSVRKTEKLYRHFDSLFVPKTLTKDLKNFSLPDRLRFQNGTMALTSQTWSSLAKEKLVVQLAGQNLFDFVYLVSLLRTVHRNYFEVYDVVLLRSTYEEYHAYLSNVKRNLAFDEYYIATGSADELNPTSNLPAVFIVNAHNEVTYQANHTNPLFKQLNAPIEAKKEEEVAAYWADIDQKKDSLRQFAIRTKDSIRYQATHENITFILKGLWDEGLSTRLIPLRYTEADTIADTTLPYLAWLEVVYPQYTAYQLLVMVTGKKQELTITSGDAYRKTVQYATPAQGRFHEAIQSIDKNLELTANYGYLLKTYPFQQSDFIKHIRAQAEIAEKEVQKAVHSKKKGEKVLQRYAEVKREQVRQMM